MKRWLILSCALAWVFHFDAAWAAKNPLDPSCTVAGSVSSTAPYDPFSSSTNNTQGSFTLSCTRGASDNPFPATFWLGIDNGSYGLRLNNGGAYISRNLLITYSPTACSSTWDSASGILISNAGNTGNGVKNITSPGTFCFSIPGSQLLASPPSYSDTVTVTVRSDSSTGAFLGTGTINLSTTVNPACSITSAPSTLTLNYTSFGAAANASSNFQVRCTNGATYSLALDATGGTLLGLNYTLGLSTTSSKGTASPQTFTVNASIPAGQAGTCNMASCSGTNTHTLTVSY